MANKRIYQLSETVVRTGRYLPVDKVGNSEAERFPLELLLTTTTASDTFAPIGVDYRCDEVAVIAGSQTINFLTQFKLGTDYSLVVLDVIMADGTKTFGVASSLTIIGFDFDSMEAGTLKYLAIAKR